MRTPVFMGKNGEIYNVGSDNYFSNLKLAKTILDMLEKPDSLIKFIADRKGHDKKYALDCSKIKKELGWKEETSFSTGLKKILKKT